MANYWEPHYYLIGAGFLLACAAVVVHVGENHCQIPVYYLPTQTHVPKQYRARVRRSPISRVPGPWITKWTDVVLKYKGLTGQKTTYVHSLHEKYGISKDTPATAA